MHAEKQTTNRYMHARSRHGSSMKISPLEIRSNNPMQNHRSSSIQKKAALTSAVRDFRDLVFYGTVASPPRGALCSRAASAPRACHVHGTAWHGTGLQYSYNYKLIQITAKTY